MFVGPVRIDSNGVREHEYELHVGSTSEVLRRIVCAECKGVRGTPALSTGISSSMCGWEMHGGCSELQCGSKLREWTETMSRWRMLCGGVSSVQWMSIEQSGDVSDGRVCDKGERVSREVRNYTVPMLGRVMQDEYEGLS